MTQRADIISNIQKATSLAEQGRLVAELDRFDRETAERHQAANSADWAAMVVTETLAPATAHERSTHETDWLGEITASTEDWANRITAEAALWFGRVSDEVKADHEEFTEQARGMARHTASGYGEVMADAEETFLSYVTFLHKQSASGLDQVEQVVDNQENPKPTALPTDVFDTFQPPVHPINSGVSGTESSENAPLLQEIEGQGGGGTTETHHDTTQQFQGPAPVEARPGVQGTTAARDDNHLPCPNHEGYSYDKSTGDCSCGSNHHRWASSNNPGGQKKSGLESPLFTPTLAIGHVTNLTDYLASLEAEAASGLDQVQQVVDAQENPKPTPLPVDVAYPWTLEEQPEAEERSDVKTSGLTPQQQAEHVARLSAKPDSELTDDDRQEIRAFAASLFTTADQWTQGQPQFHGPSAANSPYTTPEGTSGSYEQGAAEGRSDWPQEAPTYADDSASTPAFVKGHSEGYQDAAQANPVPGAATPGMLPPGAGGMGSYTTHAGSFLVTTGSNTTTTGATNDATTIRVEAKIVTCDSCGKEGSHFNMTQIGTGHDVKNYCTDCKPITPEHGRSDPWTKAPIDWRRQSGLQVSAAFTSPIETSDPDFAKAYKYAAKWAPGTRLVKQGSPAFEAGLYAGMSDNSPEHQAAWTQVHAQATTRYRDRSYRDRIRKHEEFTQIAAKALEGFVVEGAYLVPDYEPGLRQALARDWTEEERANAKHSLGPDHKLPINTVDDLRAAHIRAHQTKASGVEEYLAGVCKAMGHPLDCEHKENSKSSSLQATAATSTDLDTMGPGVSPSATGETPINGPGTPPPLQGGTDPNRPGGPAPYNAAPPYGDPKGVVPRGASQQPHNPAVIDTTPGGPVDQAAYQRLSPQTRAFRQTVQANLLETKQH